MRKFSRIVMAILLAGCQSSNSSIAPEIAAAERAADTATAGSSTVVTRFPPLYPVKAAKAGEDGCATIDYVITPELTISQVEVVKATADHFAIEASKVIPRWKWGNLPEGTITEPMKLRTRFEFCLSKTDVSCEVAVREAPSVCPGDDVVVAAGSRIKRMAMF